MRVISINEHIGWASSGVEYAQVYREKLLEQTSAEQLYVFTSYFGGNFYDLAENIGFDPKHVINLYQSFTDVKVTPNTYRVEQIEKELGIKEKQFIQSGDEQSFYYYQNGIKGVVSLDSHKQVVKTVSYYHNETELIQIDYYTHTKIFTEFWSSAGQKGNHVYLRRYYNEDGSVALEVFLEQQRETYQWGNQFIDSKAGLMGLFLDRQDLQPDDLILVDRADKFPEIMLTHKGAAKVGVVVHAEHYSPKNIDEEYILWNNYYEYELSHAEKYDYFICATDEQSQCLSRQLEKYRGVKVPVITIPVGSLDKLRTGDERQPFSIVTSSRLASEKHIDWLIKAVNIVHEVYPQVTLTIYGSGGERAKLDRLVTDLGAGNFIGFKGHVQDMQEHYQKYEYYVSASTSEGFGLSMMEALGSGLIMISIDAPYGASAFVKPNENGYLVPRTDSQGQIKNDVSQVQEMVKVMKKALVEDDLAKQRQREASYDIAKEFMTISVSHRWQKLINQAENKAIRK